MFNTTAVASLWNFSLILFLVKSLNTVDSQPRRFSFSNTMLILHNTCSQQVKVSFAWVLICCHLLCRWKFRFMHLICINYFFFVCKGLTNNAWKGHDSQRPTFTLYYQILREYNNISCQAVFLQNTACIKIR